MQQTPQVANAWRILFLLFLANLFNFFDRTIPAIIIEPIRLEWRQPERSRPRHAAAL